MLRRLAVLLLMGGVLYGAAEAAAKVYAERQIATYAAESNPLPSPIEAKVSWPLIWGILTDNTVRRIEVSSSEIAIGPVVADRAEATAKGVHLDRSASLGAGRPVVVSVDRLEGMIEISEAELSKVLPRGLKFDLSPGVTTLTGSGFNVGGRLTVRNKTVTFQPASGSLPAAIRVPSWALPDLPFASCLQGLEAGEGVLRVRCSLDDPPTPGFLGA